MKWTLRASLWFKGKEERQKEKVTKKGSERKGVNLKRGIEQEEAKKGLTDLVYN